MGEKKKVTNREWSMAIREARSFISNYDKYRWKVVTLALGVCDYSHGGRKESQFSLKKFSAEIGLNSKTLYEWVAVKRKLLDKLPTDVLKKEAINKRGFQDLKLVADKLELDSSASEAKTQYMQFFAQKPEEIKFSKYLKTLKTLLYNSQRPITMLEVSTEILEEMIAVLLAISGGFEAELEIRKKYGPKERLITHKKEIATAIREANS